MQLLRFALWSILLITLSVRVQAEGTRQLCPTATDRVFLYTNSTPYNNFGRYGSDEDQRLYFHVADPEAEQVFLGFSVPVSSGHYPCNGSVTLNGFFRIIGPDGQVVYPTPGHPEGVRITADNAITTYAEAVAGPTPVAGSGGYTPFVFDPSGFQAGDYHVEFSRSVNIESAGNIMAFEWFDITVATKAATPRAIDGRVFAYNWALFVPSVSCGTDATYHWFDRPFNGAFYPYSNENVVTRVDFAGSGFQPAAFNMVVNNSGTTMTGDIINDRKSRNNLRSSSSLFRIFLNDPDQTVYPSAALGVMPAPPSLVACADNQRCIEVSTTEPGQLDILLEFDVHTGNFVFDENSRDVLLAYEVTPAPEEQPPYVRCIPWDGKDGLGMLVVSPVDLQRINLLTRYAQGVFHLPLYDSEYLLHGFRVTTIRPTATTGSPERVYYDDMEIPDHFGIGITAPQQNPINGCAMPCHNWNNPYFGDLNTINTWFFAVEQHQEQFNYGACPIMALEDYDTTFSNKVITTPVLSNDPGAANMDTTNIYFATLPANGVVEFDVATATANYTPDSGFIGTDTFSYAFCYRILPEQNLCDSTEVFITVLANQEDCTNGLDDDGDGLIDCEDPDCQPLRPDRLFRND